MRLYGTRRLIMNVGQKIPEPLLQPQGIEDTSTDGYIESMVNERIYMIVNQIDNIGQSSITYHIVM